MKLEIEQTDIEAIAEKLMDRLKHVLPRFSEKKESNSLMTVQETAAYLKVSVQFIYKLTQAKEIPHIKKGSKILLFRQREIDKWLDTYRIPTTQASRRTKNYRTD